jgi:hypothetical protein
MSQEELPIYDFDGDDTCEIRAEDLPPGEFPPVPKSELPEGWINLSHSHTHANMSNVTECFWTNEGYVLRVHLLLNGVEVPDQRMIYPISKNPKDSDMARRVFEEVCKSPIEIESVIFRALTRKDSAQSSETQDVSVVRDRTAEVKSLLRRIFLFWT